MYGTTAVCAPDLKLVQPKLLYSLYNSAHVCNAYAIPRNSKALAKMEA